MKKVFWLLIFLIIAGIIAAAYLLIQEQEYEVNSFRTAKTNEVTPIRPSTSSRITISKAKTLATLAQSAATQKTVDGKYYCWADVSNLSSDNVIRAYTFADSCPNGANEGMPGDGFMPYVNRQLLEATTTNQDVRNLTKTKLGDTNTDLITYTYVMRPAGSTNKTEDWNISVAFLKLPSNYAGSKNAHLVLINGYDPKLKNEDKPMTYNEFIAIVRSLTFTD